MLKYNLFDLGGCFMVKDIFYKIMTDSDQRDEFNGLNDSHDAYEFFCQKGYRGSFEEFEKDMKAFLESAEARKIVSDFGSFNLSEDMLDMVAGGNNVRGILTDGISNLNNMFIK